MLSYTPPVFLQTTRRLTSLCIISKPTLQHFASQAPWRPCLRLSKGEEGRGTNGSGEKENGDNDQGKQKEKKGNGEGRGVATLERETENTFDTVLQELTAIQSDGPRNIAILGTRYSSYLHQQMIELLTYANVLIGNHVFTSGAGGTNAAVIRGALRAEKPHLLTVVLPQSLSKQPKDIQEQLKKVTNLIQMSENDDLPLDIASQLCNSDILSRCTHFTAFAFHSSDVVYVVTSIFLTALILYAMNVNCSE